MINLEYLEKIATSQEEKEALKLYDEYNKAVRPYTDKAKALNDEYKKAKNATTNSVLADSIDVAAAAGGMLTPIIAGYKLGNLPGAGLGYIASIPTALAAYGLVSPVSKYLRERNPEYNTAVKKENTALEAVIDNEEAMNKLTSNYRNKFVELDRNGKITKLLQSRPDIVIQLSDPNPDVEDKFVEKYYKPNI